MAGRSAGRDCNGGAAVAGRVMMGSSMAFALDSGPSPCPPASPRRIAVHVRRGLVIPTSPSASRAHRNARPGRGLRPEISHERHKARPSDASFDGTRRPIRTLPAPPVPHELAAHRTSSVTIRAPPLGRAPGIAARPVRPMGVRMESGEVPIGNKPGPHASPRPGFELHETVDDAAELADADCMAPATAPGATASHPGPYAGSGPVPGGAPASDHATTRESGAALSTPLALSTGRSPSADCRRFRPAPRPDFRYAPWR